MSPCSKWRCNDRISSLDSEAGSLRGKLSDLEWSQKVTVAQKDKEISALKQTLEELRLSQKNPCELRVLSLLQKQLDSPDQADFTLVGEDGTEILVHKFILANQSTVFRAMFSTDCKEVQEGRWLVKGIATSSIKAMVSFLYGFGPEWTFEMEMDLCVLSDRYDIKELVPLAVGRLLQSITLENVARILILADQHLLGSLKNGAFDYLQRNLGPAVAKGVLVELHDLGMDKKLLEEMRDRAKEGSAQPSDPTVPVQ